jgi:5-(carboxyamino)imidazole ribonucleotide mutase
VNSVSNEYDVGLIMGSKSDWDTFVHAAEMLDELGIAYQPRVVSAHRTPDFMVEYAHQAVQQGFKVIIAGAGGAAHLPGMVASMTSLPVIGVPIQSKALNGLDSLLSIVQMPAAVPVATMAIGVAGAKNAALMAARILAISDAKLRKTIEAYADDLRESVLAQPDPRRSSRQETYEQQGSTSESAQAADQVAVTQQRTERP